MPINNNQKIKLIRVRVDWRVIRLKNKVCAKKCVSEANQSQSWLVSNKIKKQSVCKKCVSEVNQSQS